MSLKFTSLHTLYYFEVGDIFAFWFLVETEGAGTEISVKIFMTFSNLTKLFEIERLHFYRVFGVNILPAPRKLKEQAYVRVSPSDDRGRASRLRVLVLTGQVHGFDVVRESERVGHLKK